MEHCSQPKTISIVTPQKQAQRVVLLCHSFQMFLPHPISGVPSHTPFLESPPTHTNRGIVAHYQISSSLIPKGWVCIILILHWGKQRLKVGK